MLETVSVDGDKQQSTPAAERMRRHRERKRNGMRCIGGRGADLAACRVALGFNRVGRVVLACQLHPQLQTYGCNAANRRFGPIADIATSQRDVRSTSSGRYLTFSQTIMRTPSRPSIGLLLGAVFIVKVSPSNLRT